MIWVYVAGIMGSFAVGVFTPPAWKRFLLIGVILFLAFGFYGFLFFAAGSFVSLVDDYLLENPDSRIQSIVFNKVPEALMIGIFVIVAVLAIIAIVYRAVKLIV
ncbi:hypothetical protein EPN15_03920 [Patescibacteria group bacterium]|nr:MAG: hypothetical protein EPN15_03920 [Patescibacteria group bacterium]